MSDNTAERMGSLLSRMTTSEGIKFNDNQVTAVIEVLVPKIATTMPGMPAGMRCEVTPDEKGWTIRVDKPQ